MSNLGTRDLKTIDTIGIISKENLPIPFVHYPGIGGIFIAFSNKEGDLSYFCACSRIAILNYIKLRQLFFSKEKFILIRSHFPNSVKGYLPAWEEGDYTELIFREKICHKCNLAKPSYIFNYLTYVGSSFYQDYGWYIEQAYLAYGLYLKQRDRFEILPEYTPLSFQSAVKNLQLAVSDYQPIYSIFREIETERYRGGSNDYPINLLEQDRKVVEDLEIKVSKARRELSKHVENIVRVEFGYKPIGEAWVSETTLLVIIKTIFPDRQILFHHRPQWLQGLELDIFIPSINTGVEYQGIQHFLPVEAWGGDAALARTQARDKRKKEICEKLGYKLIYINYFDPLTEEFVKQKILGDNIEIVLR